MQFQRFWLWAKRQNHTYRPNRPLTPVEETQSVIIYEYFFYLLFQVSLVDFFSVFGFSSFVLFGIGMLLHTFLKLIDA